ncbi:MAG: outer membrane protein assembly factor BamA [Gemmatimonadales bacterium]
MSAPSKTVRRTAAATAYWVVCLGAMAAPLAAQTPTSGVAPAVDSIAVEGNSRNSADQIILVSGLLLHSNPTYRDVQKVIDNLYNTGQFDDVRVRTGSVSGKFIVTIVVKERPLLLDWTVTGVAKLPRHDIDDLARLAKARPIDRAAVAHVRYQIDSAYHKSGYYSAHTDVTETAVKDGVRLTFAVTEGSRVTISQVEVEGNSRFSDAQLVKVMDSKPEGFLWFRSGSYDERKLDRDIRDHLPAWYGQHGLIDMQVVKDTLIPDEKTGKAILRLAVEEGQVYQIGTISIVGNRRFSTEELGSLIPFAPPDQIGSGKTIGGAFDRTAWENATTKANELYANNGYINGEVVTAEQSHRTLADGTAVLDLRWRVVEGQPATINKIEILGNEVTHERIIREAIVLLPGELFNRERLIRSYQNIANLGFFQQPMPVPDVKPAANGVDVDVIFRVVEKHTGNINFGASVGQGTGLGGFLGLEEPNLFGRGKHGKLQWQFGQNITDFQLSYTDPTLFDSRLSGTATVYDSRLRYIVGDLGQQNSTGASLQVGMPFLGSRYSRVFASYGLQHVRYSNGSVDLQSAFQCAPCTRSTLGLTFVRDTRVGLPFPVAGNMVTISTEQNGGPLGGDGNYQKVNIDTRWFTPLGTVGAKRGTIGGGVQFTLGLTAKSGFIFGNTGNFFTELYSMGGVQYGIPLRGYDEFSITPSGFNPQASSQSASQQSFGKSYAAFTTEAGARLSQSIYVDLFFDAGNVYRNVEQYNPTRLFRGVGIGAAVVSPLGPIGVDLAYGLDRTDLLGHPAPGWKLHFRLGNFF